MRFVIERNTELCYISSGCTKRNPWESKANSAFIHGAYRFWWGNLRERGHLEDPGVDGRIILRWIFRKRDVRVSNGSIGIRIGTGDRIL
jgi:hypothetical protein